MKYPEFLKEGGTIAFASPSLGAFIEPYKTEMEYAVKLFESRGFRVDLGPNTYLGEGVGISNTPEKCAAELADYYAHHGDVLIPVGGGELMCETLEKLDLSVIAGAEPKWYLGYSDNTHFGFLLPTLFDTASIYGPHAPNFGMQPLDESLEDTLDLLMGKTVISHGYERWELESPDKELNPLAPYNLTEPTRMTFCQWDGSPIQGRFLGGCLDVLNNLCGTRFDKVREFNERYKEEGVIWFMEACEYNAMGIRRTLWHLKNAGWFDSAKAFVFGRPLCIADEPDVWGVDPHSAVTAVLEEFGLPILLDADFGHLSPRMPLINGGYGILTPYKEANIQIRWQF